MMIDEPEQAAEETPAHLREGIPKEDPYPRIILVCIGIFVVLIMVIFGVIAFDMARRTEQRVLPTPAPREAPESPPAEASPQ